MKFIHAADLHLDTPFISINNFSEKLQSQLKKSTYTAADKVFETAIKEQVDFIILAGDVFDNTERSLNAQMYLKNKFDELNKYNIKVYMIYGNHDYYRNAFSVIDFPNNVTVFSDEITTEKLITKDGLSVGITGFSYYRNHVTDDMVSNYPTRSTFDYQIGILHAGIGDNNYAPFTVNELLTKGYNYWALGHIHKREILNRDPYVVYPGDTQGRNQNELGEKGFYLINVEGNVSKLTFVPSSVYIWKNAEINASENSTLNDLTDKISDLLSENSLLTLNITNAQRLNEEVIKSIDRGDVLNQFAKTSNSAILYKIYLKFSRNQEHTKIDQKYWDDSASDIFDLDDIKDMDNKLYSEDIIRDHINDPGFLDHIKEMTKNNINKKYIGD
ncbi:DNA repair exonuclease [Companilactobacillus allii]|uniref:Metallophosphoesterase n=1 Tax=Companilactobacillus allii TaxID=1847728 RepID=A0A1P8Q3U4_9LACO|nr:DNA repair exonuclease [Companilactobacillus allii]APX72515.1 metallophosphoesterase [Companilactobacillus allii]USQ69618.1 DNA repair exonuclease [Companilactobacillus allii]